MSRMANRLKIEGIVLMTVGAAAIVGSPVVLYSSDVSHIDAIGFWLGEFVGLVLIVAGAWPYYLGWKAEKKGV